jgi:UDPglucose--hexose-1-phosphate uridylyltransferase
MTELRWNPTLREWVSTASHRQDRPVMPEDWCPFCPGSGRVPENYDCYIYPNDFPAFSIPPPPAIQGDDFYRVARSQGKCDVVLYHPDHNTSLPQLPVDHLVKLVQLWRKRFAELKATPGIRYVLIFENKGAVIGVTMPHPHGQIYAFPFIPPRLEREIQAARAHQRAKRRCLFCDILKKERADGRRIVAENEAFTAFVPFYARWPFEVHIFARRHLGTLDQLRGPVESHVIPAKAGIQMAEVDPRPSASSGQALRGGDEGSTFISKGGPQPHDHSEERSLAEILKWVTLKYDNLFQMSFPYMMLLHQAPTKGNFPYFHFHIEFYPPHRSKEKLKYLAGVETGAGTFLNDSLAEEKAAELRAVPPVRREEVEK